MRPLLLTEDSKSQKKVATIFHEHQEVPRLIPAVTSSCGKTPERFLMLLHWDSGQTEFKIYF